MLWIRLHPLLITVSGIYTPVLLILGFESTLAFFYPEEEGLAPSSEEMMDFMGGFIGVVGIVYACVVAEFWSVVEARTTEIRTLRGEGGLRGGA